MKSHIDPLIEAYGLLEQDVRRQSERWCGPFCAVCPHVCCRPHFCQESIDSVFLRRVVRRFSGNTPFVPSAGWLGPTGCGLSAGRPPVCYEFVCERISAASRDEPFRHHALSVLCMAMTHVGKRAIGPRHLVEVTKRADVKRIAVDRCMTRLDEARAAYDAAVAVLEGRPSEAGMRKMSIVVPPFGKNGKKRRRMM